MPQLPLSVQVLSAAQISSSLAYELKHPPALAHLSKVHGLPSSQFIILVSLHVPLLQVSASEQKLPSLHATTAWVVTQPK